MCNLYLFVFDSLMDKLNKFRFLISIDSKESLSNFKFKLKEENTI